MSAHSPPAWRRYLRFWGSNVSGDVDDELRFHMEMRITDYMARGLSPDDARRLAAQRFGSVDAARAQCITIDQQFARTEGRSQMLANLAQDTAYAFRVLRRQWLPAAAAAVCVAVGVAATTAMFSVVDALLLRPLPYPNGARVVTVLSAKTGAAFAGVASYADYLDWRNSQRSFDDMTAMREANFVVLHGDAERTRAALVTGNFFATFGITPEVGRLFSPGDDTPGAAPVIVVSDEFARGTFGDPERALNQSLVVNGAARTIVGVVADVMRYPSRDNVWLPIHTGGYNTNQSRGERGLTVLASLRAGVSLDAARRDMTSIAARLAREYPNYDAELTTRVAPLREQYVNGSVRTGLAAMVGAAVLILLIACANVAALQLARAAARTREMAVRAAIGAGRGRIVRQLLTESVLLSLVGGVGGALLAYWTRAVIARAVVPQAPAWMTFDIDRRALAFALVVSAATGIAFGIAPALRLAGVRTAQALRGGLGGSGGLGSTRAGLQRTLVAVEIALSVMLVVAAALALESVWRMEQIPLGVDPNGVLAFDVTMEGTRYDVASHRAALVAALEDRLRAIPGVTSAGAADRMPIQGCCSQFGARIEGQAVAEGHEPMITGTIATPGYFETLGIQLLAGRTFTAGDDSTAPPVTVINETFAKRYWPKGDAIGHHVNTGAGDARIVGIVRDIKQTGLLAAPEPQFFRPYAEDPWTRATFAVRSMRDPASLAADVRRVVRAIDPAMPVFNVVTLNQLVDQGTFSTRSLGRLFVGCACIALLLAATGLYGLISFLVERRTRELGLRVALGAEPGRVARLVMLQAGVLTAIGLIAGTGAAALAARWLASTLYGVSASQPGAYLVAAAILGVTALVASYGPARRASSVDPMVALRAE